MALIQGVLTIVGASVIMLILNVPMALTVMLSAPASFVARYITLKSQKRFGQQAAIVGELNGYAEEYIDGLQL